MAYVLNKYHNYSYTITAPTLTFEALNAVLELEHDAVVVAVVVMVNVVGQRLEL